MISSNTEKNQGEKKMMGVREFEIADREARD